MLHVYLYNIDEKVAGPPKPNILHLMCEWKPLWSPIITDVYYHLFFSVVFLLGNYVRSAF